MMTSSRDTLYLLVTCSLEPSRARIARRVLENLQEQDRAWPFFENLLVFDNGSTQDFGLSEMSAIQKRAKCVRSDRNVGYWTAIDWVLANASKLMGRDYRYLYIIESDLIHNDMHRLGEAEVFLNEHPEIGSIRTQEFSVKDKHLYDKNKPVRGSQKHAWVALYNAITREDIWFKEADSQKRIFSTNFHTKLPALNRIESLKGVFSELRAMSDFTEYHLMEGYYRRHPVIGLLDGGLFRMDPESLKEETVTGSYTSGAQLNQVGYHSTRTAQILKEPFEVKRLN